MSETTPPAVTVVVPVFDEQDNVQPLADALREVLARSGESWEILFIDDGSRDGTLEALRAIHASDPRIRVIRFRQNFGQTAATQAGFDHARGSVVVTMDGDLQNDPADIPKFLEAIREGHDVVVGWRKDRRDKLLTRKVPSWIANRLIASITGVPIHDNGCSLKAYRIEVLRRTQIYGEMHRFIPAMMSLSGASVCEIVVHHRARRFGRSKYGLSRTFRVVSDLVLVKMLTGFTTRPALWFGLLSLPFLALTALFLALSGYHYLGDSADGPSAIVFPTVSLLFAFAFLQMILVGVVAELVVWSGDYRESDSILTVEAGEPEA